MKLNFNAFGDCVAKIVERGRMTEGEAKQILQEVASRAEQMRATGQADPFVSAAAEMATQLTENAKLDHADALRNAAIRNNIMASIDKAGGIKAARQFFREMFHGTNSGGRDSIEGLWQGLSNNWQAQLGFQFEKLGLKKALKSGALDKEFSEALWREHGGTADPNVKVSSEVQQAAKATKVLQDAAKTRLNAAGARIGDAMDYVAHTDHDPIRMREAAGPGKTVDEAFAAWWAAEKPLWSEKTFEGLAPGDQVARDDFGRSVFKALASGIHMKTADIGEGTYIAPAFEGSRNLARKMSQSRVIHYKDAASWLEHQQRFGASPNVGASIMRTLDQSARNSVLMERLGTNPMANFNQIVDKLGETYRNADLDATTKFRGSYVAGLRNILGRLDGSLNVPESQMWADFANSIRSIETMKSLGGVGITHAAALPVTAPSELVHHNVGRFEAMHGILKGILSGKGPVEKQEIMADLGAYSSGLTRSLMAKWRPGDGVMGGISSAASHFMEWTGVHYLLDSAQGAVKEMLAHQLGRLEGTAYQDLDPRLSQMLGKYGIGEPEWAQLQTAERTTFEDRKYLTPFEAGKIDPALSDKLLSYYNDAARHSTVTPGVRERAMMLGSSRPGSLSGELYRFVSQFKMWPLAAWSQIILRDWELNSSKAKFAWGLAPLVALSAVGGYARMSINDLALGNPRRPITPATLLAAVAQGGGVGIVGDFLFGEVNRMGAGWVSTAMGPVFSDVDTLSKIYNRFRADITDPNVTHKAGKFADLWSDIAHFAVGHIPAANLFYLKGTLDYMLMYHIYDAASPGWWERTNKRLEKERGRTMTGYVPGGGVPWGMPWLYMKNKQGQTFGALGEH